MFSLGSEGHELAMKLLAELVLLEATRENRVLASFLPRGGCLQALGIRGSQMWPTGLAFIFLRLSSVGPLRFLSG